MSNTVVWVTCLMLLLIGWVLLGLSFKWPRYRKGMMAFYLVFQVGYLLWRVTGTIPTNTMGDAFFGSLLVVTEILSFTQTAVFVLLFWKIVKIIANPVET